MNVTVLFDAYYLCATVTKAVENKGWHYICVGKSNRRFATDNRSHLLRTYESYVLRRCGTRRNIAGLSKTHSYRVAWRVGTMKKLGAVQVVFSRRRGDGKAIALVTNDLTRPASSLVPSSTRRATDACRVTRPTVLRYRPDRIAFPSVDRSATAIQYRHDERPTPFVQQQQYNVGSASNRRIKMSPIHLHQLLAFSQPHRDNAVHGLASKITGFSISPV
jgi:hypothetical protein